MHTPQEPQETPPSAPPKDIPPDEYNPVEDPPLNPPEPGIPEPPETPIRMAAHPRSDSQTRSDKITQHS
jgi:hypothetical protein